VMKTVFSRILIAQVVTVVLALAVMTAITRISLNQGFKDFLQQQENAVLETVAPVLTDIYAERGSWDFLRDNPVNWQRIWRMSRGGEGPGPGFRRGPPHGSARSTEDQPEAVMRWMRPPDRVLLRDRLFLLDEKRVRIAGAEPGALESVTLQPLETGGQPIGWIGFRPMGNALPPDAERFLSGQIMIMAASLAVSMLVAALLAWVLARNVSRPVGALGETLTHLSEGDFAVRAGDVGGDEIARLAANVNRLAATLEQNRTARRRWMADIAHELRTPVAVLKGEIEALSDGVRPADERMATSLAEEVDHLTALIDDLQTLALSDAGALNIRKEPLDLAELVSQTAGLFRERLAERRIVLDMDIPSNLVVAGDAQRIRQLLHNLFENATRYVEDAGRIRLCLQATGGAELVLEDSGPGVGDDQLQRLFERFYRAEGSRSRVTGGSGLGLAICRNIAEAHGGAIEASHSELGGLKIRVRFPA
jgi:two-component system sensor histidine kinase BaeS